MKNTLFAFTTLGLIGLATLTPAYGHGHINAGAIDTNSDGLKDKLNINFEPGTNIINSADNGGAGIYGDDGFRYNGYNTFAALHQSQYPSEGGGIYYSSAGALSGSYIQLQLVSITSSTGGGTFAFYDDSESTPTWTYSVGATTNVAGLVIDLTEQAWYDRLPVEDVGPILNYSNPFGHIHNRTFAVDNAGTYTLTWKLIDVGGIDLTSVIGSANMADSDTFTQTFVAVPEPSTWLLIACGAGLLLWMRRCRSVA